MNSKPANMAKVFKNTVPNCKVFTPEGRQITFVHGKHITQIKKDIEYLNSIVEAGDQYVYIDPEESEVDVEELTAEGRMAKLKREAVEEYLATVAAATAKNSTSDQNIGVMPGTSSQMVNAVESNGPATVKAPETKVESASAAPTPTAPTAPAGIKAVISK